MDSFTTSFWDVMLWTFWIFIWITAILVWFRCIFDLFSDWTLSGWAKAGWVVVLVFVPFIGAVSYLVVRNSSINERQEMKEQRKAQEFYREHVAPGETFA